MTYIDAIKKLLNKAGEELTYPVNINVHFLSANHIQFELDEGRDINEILEDEIKNSNHIGIRWLDNQNKINSITLDDNYGVTKSSNSSDELTKESFNNKQFTVIGKDNKFRLLLYPLEENIEIEEDGFIKEKILEHEEIIYEVDKIKLPCFKDYKYKNLYNYDNEKEFSNAILLEFILRHINHNNLAPDKIEINLSEEENATEEELYYIEHMKFQKIESEINRKLINIFGLSYDEINKLKLVYSYEYNKSLDEDNIITELKYSPSSIVNIEINLTYSLEKLIEQITKLKNDFDRAVESCLNLKERVSKEYLIKANEVLEKFPKSFEKKKDDLIKALFIFDYIRAYNKNTDELNIPTIEEYETKKIEINNKYLKKQEEAKKEIEKFEVYKKEAVNFEEKIRIEKQNTYQKVIDILEKDIIGFERNKKKELREIEKKLKNKLGHHTKMDPLKYKNSLFNEIASIINERPKQCTKIHSFIHKFLETNY